MATATPSPSSSPTAASGQISFSYTSPEGWHYTGSIPWPRYSATFNKDVSSSPPGQAQFAVTINGENLQYQRFDDDNPGRPGGPQLQVAPGYLAFSSAAAGGGDHGLGALGPCDFMDNQFGYEPFAETLDCDLSHPLSGVSDNPAPEQEVDALVTKLNAAPPTYVTYMGVLSQGVFGQDPVGTCNVFISSSGAVRKADAYDETVCGSLTMSVTP